MEDNYLSPYRDHIAELMETRVPPSPRVLPIEQESMFPQWREWLTLGVTDSMSVLGAEAQKASNSIKDLYTQIAKERGYVPDQIGVSGKTMEDLTRMAADW